MPRKLYDMNVIKLSNTTFEVQSQSNPLISYKVVNKKGVWHCECGHFLWRLAGTDQDCKHIQRVKAARPESLRVKFRQAPMVGKILAEMLKM